MDEDKKDFSDKKFEKTFGLTDSSNYGEALNAFRASKAYLKKHGLSFKEYFQKKERAIALAQSLSNIDEENSRLEAAIFEVEKSTRTLKQQIDRKKAEKIKSQNPSAANATSSNTSSIKPPSNTKQTGTRSTQPPPPSPPPPPVNTARVPVKRKNNPRIWVGCSLAGIFLFVAIDENDNNSLPKNERIVPIPSQSISSRVNDPKEIGARTSNQLGREINTQSKKDIPTQQNVRANHIPQLTKEESIREIIPAEKNVELIEENDDPTIGNLTDKQSDIHEETENLQPEIPTIRPNRYPRSSGSARDRQACWRGEMKCSY